MRAHGEGTGRRGGSRQRFLAAARALFADRGFQATTTRDIVATAGSSMGNLYFYFADKEAVLRALMDEAATRAEQSVDAALARFPPGPAALASAVITATEALFAEADIARIVFLEAPQTGLRREVIDRFSARVRTLFEQHPEMVRGLAPRLAAAAWIGAIWQASEQALTANTPIDARDLGVSLARWNLRAIGVHATETETAIALAVAHMDAGLTA